MTETWETGDWAGISAAYENMLENLRRVAELQGVEVADLLERLEGEKNAERIFSLLKEIIVRMGAPLEDLMHFSGKRSQSGEKLDPDVKEKIREILILNQRMGRVLAPFSEAEMLLRRPDGEPEMLTAALNEVEEEADKVILLAKEVKEADPSQNIFILMGDAENFKMMVSQYRILWDL